MAGQDGEAGMQVVDLDMTLMDMPYPVTRRLRVPLGITLAELHKVLQAAMPWEDGHLHDFSLGRALRWAVPHADDWGDTRDERKETLAQVIAGMGRKKAFTYTYDMGDSWEHEIRPGKPRDLAEGEAPVALLAAAGRCPPEDSGGAPGFDRMLQVAADPADDEHEDIVEWLGDLHPWNPAADGAALTAAVAKAGQRIVKRLAKGN
jgi:hypothetical protein